MKKILSIAVTLAALAVAGVAPALAAGSYGQYNSAYGSQPGPGSGIESQR